MSENEEDRRTRRTREALIHALLDLIEHKHYDQISVQDIAQQANIGRSTFYDHYENKDALLLGGFSYLLDRIVAQIRLEGGEVVFDTAHFFQHAQGHYGIYRTLVWGSGFGLLVQDGHVALSERIAARLAELLPVCEPAPPLALTAATLAGGLLVMLKWWLDNKMPYSPEEMDAAFQSLVMPGIRKSFS